MDEETSKRLDAEACSFARQKMKWDRNCNQPLKEQAFEHGLKKRLNYDETAWIAEMKADDKIREQHLHNEELKRLIDGEKQQALINEKSWELFKKTLIPVYEDGSETLQNGWGTVFIDPETGAKSPTVEEIVKGEVGYSDPLAIKDPAQFMSKSIQAFDRCLIFNHTFDRAETDKEDDFGEWRRANNRYSEIKFALRAVKFPPKAPKA